MIQQYIWMMESLLQSANFWVGVSFAGLLLLALYFRAPKKITEALDQQSKIIAHELEETKRLYNKAQQLLQQQESKLSAIQNESKALLQAVRKGSVDYQTEVEQILIEKIQRQEQQAQERIKNAKNSAISILNQEAARLALSTAKGLINKKADPEELFDNAIAEIEIGLKEYPTSKH